MQIIVLETRIAAPLERCFLLSLSVDLHIASTSGTGERAVDGVTTGLMGAGDRVLWRGRHFGLMLSHQSEIARYDRPRFFKDVMTQGVFRSFEHDHIFRAEGSETLMQDVLRFEAPLGLLGRIAERFVLRRYLTRFLRKRNLVIQQVAEGPEDKWRHFIEQAPSRVRDLNEPED